MLKDSDFTVVSNEPIAKNVYKMVLRGDTSCIVNTGQFINIKLDGLYLRRPISVYDWDNETVTIIYKVVGKGTEQMSRAVGGESYRILTGLGNGYGIYENVKKPLLLGGGVGVPPLYALCRKLIKAGKKPTVIIGFNTADEVFGEEEFKKLGANVFVATADGSMGTRGFVTDVIDDVGEYDYFYACGPEMMLKAVYNKCTTSGELSFEERMGCGFGGCMGCSCKTIYGAKRICKEGPVLKKEEIIW